MAFRLGNFSIDEIIYGTAETFEGTLLYTLDQLSSASIEIASESTDITDKSGNIVRTIYKSKTGTFTATNAFLHPQLMNAASGSSIEHAAVGSTITMPKIVVLPAGTSGYTLDSTIVASSLQVIGLFGNGINSDALTKISSGTPEAGEYLFDATTYKITLPGVSDDAPINYLVKYDRAVTSGMKLTNSVKNFPSTVKLTLYCSYVDPCDDSLRAMYVVLPSFQASPETTLSLNAEEQEMDFNGAIQVDYCAANPALYYIYLPDEDAVKVVVGA